jgi:hypothetical protein
LDAKAKTEKEKEKKLNKNASPNGLVRKSVYFSLMIKYGK